MGELLLPISLPSYVRRLFVRMTLTKPRHMSLTPELIARTHRVLEDEGPDPALVYHSDADYNSIVAATLASHPAGSPFWIFAYGSLIWKPEIPHIAEMRGVARGWHRSFCFRIHRFRATRAQPGLMMALDRGGQCGGMLYRLPDSSLLQHVEKLFRREFTVKPANCQPRWITVATDDGPIRAIAFVMNRQARAYIGKLSADETAEVLASACGHWGSCAEYLYNTVAHLEAKGIHDRNLWRLQELVAQHIIARDAGIKD